MPVEPARTADGGWLHIPVELPGRILQVRVWRVTVGRTFLYLLDTNDPVNGPVDRGIAGKNLRDRHDGKDRRRGQWQVRRQTGHRSFTCLAG